MAYTFDTSQRFNVQIGAATLAGMVWDTPVIQPTRFDKTTRARAFLRRNGGKTFKSRVLLGLRFATAERLKPATPYSYPAGLHDLSRFGDVPPQSYAIEDNDKGRPSTGNQDGAADWDGYGVRESEDCLSLNIFLPYTETQNAPVVLLTDGGGGDVGASCFYYWWAQRLTLEGLIVVTANYRRGYLGNFYHPDMQTEADFDGPNFNLSDQRASRRWVYDNIKTLGGDPQNITEIASSFGGACALAHMETPENHAMIRRLFVASGGGTRSGQRRSANRAAGRKRRGYRTLCRDKTAEIFKNAAQTPDISGQHATVADAITARGELWALRHAVPAEAFQRVHDDSNIFLWRDNRYVHHPNPVSAMDAGVFPRGIDVCLAVAENECSTLGIHHQTDTLKLPLKSYARRAGFDSAAQLFSMPFFENHWSKLDRNRILYSSVTFWGAAYSQARALTAKGSKVRLLFDNYKSRGNRSDYTAHTALMGYIWGNHCLEWKVGRNKFGEADVFEQDIWMSEGQVRMFKNFATHGDPNGPLDLTVQFYPDSPEFDYIAFDPSQQNWNVIGKQGTDGINAPPQVENVAFWYADMLSTYDALQGG